MTEVVFDIETNGLDFDDGNFIDRVHSVFCLVSCSPDGTSLHKYYDTDGLRELGTAPVYQAIKELEALGPDDVLIGHNIIQFDLPVLRKLYGFVPKCRIYDTLVASRTLFPDRAGGHSLRAWGERLGYPKQQFEEFGEFSLSMLEYCVNDTVVNGRIYKALRQEHTQAWNQAIDLEHRFAEIISNQERKGFYFDRDKGEGLIHTWQEELDDLDTRINKSVTANCELDKSISKPFKINGDLASRTRTVCDNVGIDCADVVGPFDTFAYRRPNLNSAVQLKRVLLELGWKPVNYTATGEPRLDDSIKEVGELGSLVHRRNRVSKGQSKVQGLLDRVDSGSRIHGGGNPCGTNTSRMKHQLIVNIPRVTSPFGNEMRSLFAVPSGKILVGYDAASLELRILAHYIGNEEYNERITTKDKSQDAHTLAAKAAGLDDRDVGKTINYALIYGAGDTKLGTIIGGSTAEGIRLRKDLYDRIPGLGRLVDRAKSASKRGYVLSLDGRRLYTRSRVSPLNTLIQGGGSIFMKTAAVKLDELARDLDAFKVVDMHDEAQWECHPDQVDALSSYIHEAFAYACSHLNLRCPQEAEVKVGTNWAETH